MKPSQDLEFWDLLGELRSRRLISREAEDQIHDVLGQLFDALQPDEQVAKAAPDDERYWQQVRRQWAWARVSDPEQIFYPLNACNLCPAPSAVVYSINRLRAEYNENVSQQRRTSTGARNMDIARASIAKGLRVRDPFDIAIVRNASEANNILSVGYRRWRRAPDEGVRENVVAWSENHPTNLEAWRLRAQWDGGDLFEIRTVTFDNQADPDQIARAFLDRIDDNTRFVTFTETSNGNGVRIPLRSIQQIWDEIKDRDCHLHIDGAQTWGAQDVDLRQLPCHSFSASAHKWFCGPAETGILYMQRSKVEHFMPSVWGYNYRIQIPSSWREMPDNAARFELLGQRDDCNIIALAVAQTVMNVIGPARIAERAQWLASRLKDKLVAAGWRLITPQSSEKSWGVVRVEARAADGKPSLYDWIYEPVNGFRVAGSGDRETFRLSAHLYNLESDLDRAVAGMNRWRSLHARPSDHQQPAVSQAL